MGTQELLKPKYLILIILSILLVLYAMYQARFLIQGPQIVVTSHQNGFSVGGHLITIEGLAEKIAAKVKAVFPVKSMKVGIKKPRALARRGAKFAAIEIER